ncbi:MAG: hypothetical protein NT165_03865 [Candidatus Falkowbacteria bacterium]|nr:hypothetical protein [Candidatus Falkowbacteria bacterium]
MAEKTLKKVFTIAVILFIIAVFGYLISNEDQNSTKTQTNLSIKSEFQKKFSAIKVLELKTNLDEVDAFGNPLMCGQWYIRVNESLALFPIQNGTSTIGGPMGVGDIPFDFLQSKYAKEVGQISINSRGQSPGGIITAQVALTGKDEIILNTNTVKYYLKGGK